MTASPLHDPQALEAAALREQVRALKQRVAELEQAAAKRPGADGSLEQLGRMLEESPLAVRFVDGDARILYGNRKFAEIVGRPQEALIGRTMKELLPPDTAARLFACHRRVFDSGEPAYGLVHPLEIMPGKARWGRTDLLPWRDGASVAGVLVFTTDVTDLVLAEQALREAGANLEQRVMTRTEQLRAEREQSEAALDVLPANVLCLDRESRVVRANHGATYHLGRPRHEILGRSIDELRMPEIAERLGELDREAMDSDRRLDIVEEFAGIDGHRRWWQIARIPLHDAEGRVSGLMVSALDVTDVKRAELTIRETEAKASAIIDSTTDQIYAIDTSQRLVAYNSSWGAAYRARWGEEPKHGVEVFHALPPGTREFWERMGAWALGGTAFSFEYSMQVGDEVHYLDIAMQPVVTDGQITGATVFARDVTDRKRTLEALRGVEARLSAHLENSRDAVWSVDREYRVTSFNSTFSDVMRSWGGSPSKVGVRYGSILPPEGSARFRAYYDRALSGERFTVVETLSKDGESVEVEISFNPIVAVAAVTGVVAVARRLG